MLTRSVSIEGTLYREHEVVQIAHNLDKNTVARVCSKAGRERKYTQHSIGYQPGLSFAEAEAQTFALPFFAEHDDPYAEVVQEQAETIAEQAETIGEQTATIAEQEQLVDEIAEILTDDQAVEVPQAYREWAVDTAYETGDRRRYDGVLYKCLQDHTSQFDWTPDIAASLWARVIASEDPSTPAEWVQPDSTNGYSIGDRVTHNGKVWESIYDNNVWEPGVAGWEEVTE